MPRNKIDILFLSSNILLTTQKAFLMAISISRIDEEFEAIGVAYLVAIQTESLKDTIEHHLAFF
jgi:hypothetical protein